MHSVRPQIYFVAVMANPTIALMLVVVLSDRVHKADNYQLHT